LRKAGLPEESPAEATHLSIVVLPFTNLSGDPSQDYFADGVTENLTTDLSRVRDSFVIARNTAFTYKGKNVDAKEIGKELNVRYVLEGSVQRDQNRVRVNAQLIDAETGAHLWADRFEEDVADLFKLQDEVVSRLANSLDWALTKAEAEKGARSANPDAIDLYLRGRYLMNTFFNRPRDEGRDMVHQARTLFERALQIDATDVGALNETTWTYLNDFLYGWGDPGTDYDIKFWGKPIARSVSPPTMPTCTPQRRSIWPCRTALRKLVAPLTLASPSIRISPRFIRRAASLKIRSAAMSRRRSILSGRSA
jgi:TolB-like protein